MSRLLSASTAARRFLAWAVAIDRPARGASVQWYTFSSQARNGRKPGGHSKNARTVMAPGPRQRVEGLACVAAVVTASALVWFLVRGQPPLVDEFYHYEQITRYLAGVFVRQPVLSMPTGYHWAMAVMASLGGVHSLDGMRLLNLVPSLALIWLFYRVAMVRDSERAALRTLQFFFLPVLLPLYSLVYTDTTSLLVLLGCLLAHYSQRHALAGVLGSLSIVVRHNNIIFCMLVMAWTWWEETRKGSALGTKVKAVAWFLPAFLIVASMLRGFGSLAVGNPENYPTGIFTGNLMLTLLMLAVFFAPVAATTLPQATRRQVAWTAALSVVLGLLFLFAFPNNHPYNHVDAYLRNFIMYFFTQEFIFRLLFLPVIVVASWLLVSDPLEGQGTWAAYPVSLLYLLPMWVVEPRYCLVPLTLFVLLRRQVSRPAEYAVLAIEMALCAWFVSLMLSRPHHPFFP